MTDANEDTPPALNAAAPVGELADGGWATGYLTAEWVRAEVRRRRLRLALVVTALPLELESIRNHLDNLGGVRGEGGAVFECGTVSDLSQEWLIVTAETRAGTHNAQQAVSRAHSAFRSVGKFELMMFVGIGGSRKGARLSAASWPQTRSTTPTAANTPMGSSRPGRIRSPWTTSW
ncbi:hypothetical protein QP185_07630 [Sphingomonas aerolata]|uniref:hypothetical protein n=1 Tax=Sphingomonas aerolata TaxID=185951 RepID=UPI002FE1A660